MGVVESEGGNQHLELSAELLGIEMEHMIPRTEVVGNEFIYAQKAEAAASNSNIITSITGVPKIVDGAP